MDNPSNADFVVMERIQNDDGTQHYELSAETRERINFPTILSTAEEEGRGGAAQRREPSLRPRRQSSLLPGSDL